MILTIMLVSIQTDKSETHWVNKNKLHGMICRHQLFVIYEVTDARQHLKPTSYKIHVHTKWWENIFHFDDYHLIHSVDACKYIRPVYTICVIYQTRNTWSAPTVKHSATVTIHFRITMTLWCLYSTLHPLVRE